ncbi:very short patch repair endonuclease [Sphingomonas sp. QA11]|uniref:very short patch repair endonuclease n=1 Tax=Sphingomonas sp. QA11 TaxID=2950605 RepID=UPI00234BE76A|nr:very short patch repair endonuclease [Sphingomonas sp. QA11]WCM26323.1 very short patch repair endonuclease [Sphingomonas sp. QA11]
MTKRVARTTEPVDPARSAQMAKVRGRDTKPEMRVRRALHAAGVRYRLHAKDLPGRPDIVLPSRRVAIFVHGCFWHRHPDPNCKLARLPKSRLDFWVPKLEANRARDQLKEAALLDAGWTVQTIWECELDRDGLERFTREIAETPRVGRYRARRR